MADRGTYEFQNGPLLAWGNMFYSGDMSTFEQDATSGFDKSLDQWFNTSLPFERVAANQPAAFQARVFPRFFDGTRADGLNQWNANILRRIRIGERLRLRASRGYNQPAESIADGGTRSRSDVHELRANNQPDVVPESVLSGSGANSILGQHDVSQIIFEIACSSSAAHSFVRTSAEAALPKAKITRVRIYEPPNLNQLFNQSTMICTVETDIGITGIGEGGSKDTLEQCAGTLIGKNPFQHRGDLAGDVHRLVLSAGPGEDPRAGRLDMALWDIKGKALKLPVHELARRSGSQHLRVLWHRRLPHGPTPWRRPTGAQRARALRERARATMEAGYRAFRMGAGDTAVGGVFNTHERVRKVAADCKEAREGVGPDGDWCIDFHQRFDYSDAVRACRLIEEYEPYFVEDPVRDEHAHQDIPKLRQMTTVPLTHGEEWGQRYDFNKLVENHDIDYIRATLPNVGGITEMMKIAAICETHAVGIIPHFTGPISTAALVNCLCTFPGPVIMEYNYGGRPIAHLPECLDFKNGKALMNDRPGLGVTAEMKLLKQIGEVTQPGRGKCLLPAGRIADALVVRIELQVIFAVPRSN